MPNAYKCIKSHGVGGQVVLESEKSGRTDFRVLEGLLSNQFPTLVS